MILFDPTPTPALRGDRGKPIVARMLSLQSRLTNLFALALTLGVGAAFLTWYYLTMAASQSRPRESASGSPAGKAASDASWPALGTIVPPLQAQAWTSASPAQS